MTRLTTSFSRIIPIEEAIKQWEDKHAWFQRSALSAQSKQLEVYSDEIMLCEKIIMRLIGYKDTGCKMIDSSTMKPL